jgi:ABC-type nitrate/sulfonate/bicarbonate transport system substrate-binding protein
MQRRTVLRSLAVSALLAGVKVNAAGEAGPQVIRVNIPGPHLLPFIPIELISKLGIDQALGVQLAIRYLPSGILALEDALAGNAQFAGVAFSALPTFIAKGKPVSAIAVLSSGVPPYSILIRPDLAGSVRSLKDLKGRSIGIPMGSVTSKTYLQVMLELWLANQGVRSNEVRWVQTNQNLAGMQGSLVSGMVDAVFCEEPLAGTLVRKKIGLRLASLSDSDAPDGVGWANHIRAVLACPRDIVERQPQRVELMTAMLKRSLRWMQLKKPDDIVAKLGVEDAELRQDLADPIKRIPNVFSPDGRFKAEEVEASRQFLAETGTSLPAGMNIRGLIADKWVNR